MNIRRGEKRYINSAIGTIAMMSVFGGDCHDFYTDGNVVGFTDGSGTIWEETITSEWDENRGMNVKYHRHRGESPECGWTEWEVM